jgi:hypothetical protein
MVIPVLVIIANKSTKNKIKRKNLGITISDELKMGTD